MSLDSKESNSNLFSRLFRGNVPLGKTYWLYFVFIGGFCLNTTSKILQAYYFDISTSTLGTYSYIAFYWFVIVYTLFSQIAVWRSAGKFEGKIIWSALARLMVIIGFFGIVINVYSSYLAPDKIITNIKNEIILIQKSLPKMIDDSTRLDSVRLEGKEANYNYTLISTSIDDVDIEYFTQVMSVNLKTEVCSNEDVKDGLEAGISFNYYYRDKEGKPISKTTVSKEDCKFNQIDKNKESIDKEQIEKETVKLGKELKPSKIFADNSNAVVLIRTYDDEANMNSFGSGFNIHKRGIIVTNLHVVFTGDRFLDIKFPKNGTYDDVEIVGFSSTDTDLVLLRIEGSNLPVVDIDPQTTPKVGDKIYTIGNPEGYINTLSEGLISAKRHRDGTEFIQITAPISSGSSGGPVFNEYGEVIGVATEMAVEGQNLNFAVDINEVENIKLFDSGIYLKDFVDYIRAKKKAKKDK